MELDLDKFTEFADELEEGDGRQGGKYSAIYEQLDKAYETIAELVIGKNIPHKKVVELLQKSGMEEIKLHNFSGWWSSRRIKIKREKTVEQYAEAKERKATAKPVASVSDIKERSSAARASVKVNPKIDPKNIVRVEGDIQIPWHTFVTRMKQNHCVGSDVISEILTQSGIVQHQDKRYTLIKSIPDLFPNLSMGKTLVFQNVIVWGATLENFILSYVEEVDRMASTN